MKPPIKPIFGWVALWCLTNTLSGCAEPDGGVSSQRPDWLPEHFPSLPATIEISSQKRELGRWLFYDVRLSANGTRSCGTCHEQPKAFSDGLVTGLGIENSQLPLNSLSLVNVAWREELTWYRQIDSVEEHMLIPLFADNPVEMGMTESLMLERLADSERYQEWFAEVYPTDTDPISVENTIDAISAFTLSIIDGNSRYDQWYRGEIALSATEQRGMALFFGDKMQCSVCHGGLFFDQPQTEPERRHGYFNTGLYHLFETGEYPVSTQGLIASTGNSEDMGKFRVPTLRNLSMTKPWMHDGTEFDLENILDSYARGGRLLQSGSNAGDGSENPYKSDLISGFEMSLEERADLLRFLMSLNDDSLATVERLQTPFCQRRAGEIINPPCEEPFILE